MPHRARAVWSKTAAPDFGAIRRQLQTRHNLTLQLVWEEYREAFFKARVPTRLRDLQCVPNAVRAIFKFLLEAALAVELAGVPCAPGDQLVLSDHGEPIHHFGHGE